MDVFGAINVSVFYFDSSVFCVWISDLDIDVVSGLTTFLFQCSVYCSVCCSYFYEM